MLKVVDNSPPATAALRITGLRDVDQADSVAVLRKAAISDSADPGQDGLSLGFGRNLRGTTECHTFAPFLNYLGNVRLPII